MTALVRTYHLWWKLAVALALFTAWVVLGFVPHWLGPRTRIAPMATVPNFETKALFALLPAREPDELRIAFVGDSSVGGLTDLRLVLPWQLEQALGRLLPDRRVRVVNLTFVGLYARDAAVLVAKAFGAGADLVVYAVSPRVVATRPLVPWTTDAGDLALGWDVLSRHGLVTTLDLVGVDSLGRSLVYSWWPAARFRAALARATLETLEARLPAAVTDRLATLVPAAPALPQSMPWDVRVGYLTPRAEHRVDVPTRNVRALAALVRLCGREGRCLLYHIPVNPQAPRGIEPGLTDELVAFVAPRATAAGVPFHDHRTFGGPGFFKTTIGGKPDPIHPTPAGHAAFAPVLAGEVVARVAALRR